MTNLEDFIRRNQLAELGGGSDKIDKQHSQNKLTARERINLLLDAGTFEEIDRFVKTDQDAETLNYGDGVITGFGKIDGRSIFIFSQDFTVQGGSLSAAHARKVLKVQQLARQNGKIIIGINDSGGARIQEGVASLGGYADIFMENVTASGVIPQISLVMGPCAGGAVYSPALTDFIIAVNSAFMFVTGPEVVKSVLQEDISKEALGGAEVHATTSGVVALRATNEEQAIQLTRQLISYLPDNNTDKHLQEISSSPDTNFLSRINEIIPDDSSKAYDVRDFVKAITDSDSFLEIQPEYAKNIIIGFARINGISIAVVANQANSLAGCLDISASKKAARFVRFCDCFNIPILTLVDVPGFLPGSQQEHNGIIREGAKLLFAYAEASVPKITVILRKAYGGAYDVMSSKHIKADFNFALPSAEIAVMGAESAINIINRRELEAAADPIKLQAELLKEYKSNFLNPWEAARLGFLDAIILPHEVRSTIIKSLEVLKNKRVTKTAKKHGNIPL